MREFLFTDLISCDQSITPAIFLKGIEIEFLSFPSDSGHTGYYPASWYVSSLKERCRTEQ
jgi:hypothetical protein